MNRKESNQIPQLPNKTLGPISDLERHLPSDWWRSLFGSLYLKTDGDVVENDLNTQKDIDFLIEATGLEPNDRYLDLCCGQGRHCLELARRGYNHVTGLDRSRYLVRLARKRARSEHLKISYHEGDARKFRLPADSFHCVSILGNSFGYFDAEKDDASILKSVMRVLKSGGILAMDLTDGDWMKSHFEPRSWEWIDQNHFVCRERSLSEDGRRLISREVIVHAERGVIADQFYAERLFSKSEIFDLLEEVGFISIRDHGNLTSHSTREHDLGMMENRMFLTARAPRKVKTDKKQAPKFTKFTVLMGDPTIPDPVKRNGQFNEEDFTTIDKLTQALEEIGDYEFEYLNTHATLQQTIRDKRPEFVMNLCDEGFNNDAFMELHVPALLEMYHIPYTGAGPACLGLCYNKSMVRAIAASLDIPVPLETYFNPADQSATIPSIFPAIVKPNYGDSSIGITQNAVVHTPEQLINYMEELREVLPGRPVLIQEFLSGAEYSVGIIGNPGLTTTVLPVLEVDYSGLDPELPKILGYESKWHPDSPYWTEIKYHEAKLTEEQRRKILDYANLLFERLECRDYARVDFRMDARGEIKLLEMNPNPGWCWDGKMNYMAGFAGMRYSDMLKLILDAAAERESLAVQNRVLVGA
ncbi:MAG: methyltransferase domain-containing protein [Candidatus Omnitrophica bacterium]|nr:methyltransferase domain-containing protein [Candidatus Omnitrophota bacterium]MCA9436293.1 methyltransferase domain-containing protein [Candidatus Omnitrophota bacterium]MCB9769706.1 methyltransferase domain-containing protein [Candidatus Omnitrophota bacterium]MCB9782069.1 methyltransferase domain-containing protein [Candidatus Omnitrophota bacterium]